MIEEKAEVEPPIMENPYWHGPKGRGQGGAAGSAFQHRMPCVPMVGQAQAFPIDQNSLKSSKSLFDRKKEISMK